MRHHFPIALIFSVCCLLSVEPAHAASPDPDEAQMDLAWSMLWQRFRHPETHLFYDFISSYEDGHHLNHLPTAEEVSRQFPNPCGYGTGMEDSMILGGALLSTLVDRFAVTGDEEVREEIKEVFAGVERCVTVHAVPGFVARSVCPEDGKSVYINSSRDQYTHCVHGLWKYAKSPLCDDEHREQIGHLLRSIADGMIRNVTAENGFDSLRADGKRDPLGISKMWEVQAHEAARLPMIYAATWDVTGEELYRAQYRRYVAQAIEQSAEPSPNSPAYALLQMQCSLEVLHAVETDPALRTKIASCMQYVAELAANRVTHVGRVLASTSEEDRALLPPDWRTVPEWKESAAGYRIPQWGHYRHVWHHLREAGEASLITLMLPTPDESAFSTEALQTLIAESDYAHQSGCGIVYHLAAYWKARRISLW